MGDGGSANDPGNRAQSLSSQCGKMHRITPTVGGSAPYYTIPADNPFAQAKTKVDVLKVGIKNYDDFFQESAEVNGTVVLSDVVLKDTDAFIATTKKSVKTR